MKIKLALNTITSILLQVVTVISGFIIPRLILLQYGSNVNGLVQSITQFLGVITCLELGVGQVIQSALYKPLAKGDRKSFNEILASGDAFFKRIARILFVYVIILTVIYPFVIKNEFGHVYILFLIVSISISSFAQYYFGIIDNILLNADQKGYIQYASQILAIILNTAVCALLIRMNLTIQVVKLSASLIYLMRPFVVRMYVNRHYRIDRNIKYDKEPIEQKWNGIAQHVSAFILNGTDTIVLTVFSTLDNVSIYSVYHMVVYGVHQLYQSATAGVHALVGDLWAKQEIKRLQRFYDYIEIVLHFSTVFLFSCTGILIIPFISVYTRGIADINYIQPVFGILIVLAHAAQCIKTTYNIIILAGGHYKQTQKCHIISAILNIVISIGCVYKYGLIGVALGTVISMMYQMVWMAFYDSKNLLKRPFRNFIKQIIADIVTVITIICAASCIKLKAYTYFAWAVMAIKVALLAAGIVGVMAFVLYPKKMKEMVSGLLKVKERVKESHG